MSTRTLHLGGRSRIAQLTAIGVTTLAIASASAENCGNPFVNHFGPFDYRSADAATRQLVEGRHFTPGVESMIRPSTTTYGQMAADVAYTLHVFPNHARALITMSRLGERHHTDTPPGAKFSVECYFDRAVRFRPDDTVVRGLYAQYLGKHGRKDAAMAQLNAASEYAKDNPFSHFSIGLLYFELTEYELAEIQAKKARELGLTRRELIDRLISVNRWNEAESVEKSADTSAREKERN